MFCLALVGLSTPAPVSALRVATTLLEDLRASDLVVAGNVLGEEPAVGIRRLILQVDEEIAGRADGRTVSVLAPPDSRTDVEGGLTSVTVSEGIRYAVGERVLVFLKRAPPALLHKAGVETAYATIRKVGLDERTGEEPAFLADVRRLAGAGDLPDGEPRESAFLDLLSSPHGLIVESAVKELGAMRSRRAADPLARLMRDAPVPVRFQIVDAMRAIGGDEALALVRSALEDDSPRVRSRAASTLGWMHASAAEDQLLALALAEEEDEGVRINAVLALGRLGSTKAMPSLRDALEEEGLSPPLRRSMRDVLRSLRRTFEE